jgi:murein DD-endopeptidase MepM/ murein hydrolase activator NlpD
LHETAGLPGNWALDFMAPGGTPVYSVQDHLTVSRISGHDPKEGVLDGDIFGWNVYLRSASGVTYFYTHLGQVDAQVGKSVHRGTEIGTVGHWPNDPGRSHTHLGVTHPMGKKAAVARILGVAKAPFYRPA